MLSQIFAVWLWLNVVVCYYRACTVSAGEYKPDSEQPFQAESEMRLCSTCNHMRPPWVHHCKVCTKCVMLTIKSNQVRCYVMMDHHCPVTANCVGIRNYKYFFFYLVYEVCIHKIVPLTAIKLVGVSFALAISFPSFMDCFWNDRSLLDDDSKQACIRMGSHSLEFAPVLTAFLALTPLTVFQTYLLTMHLVFFIFH